MADAAVVRAAMRDCKPDVVVNCAVSAVDDAESREDETFSVNARGAVHLAAACADGPGAREIRLVHM